MTERTDEQVGKEKYKDAQCVRTSGAWKYVIATADHLPNGIGRGRSIYSAWYDAAERIRKEQ